MSVDRLRFLVKIKELITPDEALEIVKARHSLLEHINKAAARIYALECALTAIGEAHDYEGRAMKEIAYSALGNRDGARAV